MTDRKGKDRTAEQRRYERVELPRATRAVLRDAAGNETEVTVTDLSEGGAGLAVEGGFDNEDFVELHMEGLRAIPGRVARSFVEGIGMEFELSESRQKQDVEEELRKFRRTVAKKDF